MSYVTTNIYQANMQLNCLSKSRTLTWKLRLNVWRWKKMSLKALQIFYCVNCSEKRSTSKWKHPDRVGKKVLNLLTSHHWKGCQIVQADKSWARIKWLCQNISLKLYRGIWKKKSKTKNLQQIWFNWYQLGLAQQNHWFCSILQIMKLYSHFLKVWFMLLVILFCP